MAIVGQEIEGQAWDAGLSCLDLLYTASMKFKEACATAAVLRQPERNASLRLASVRTIHLHAEPSLWDSPSFPSDSRFLIPASI